MRINFGRFLLNFFFISEFRYDGRGKNFCMVDSKKIVSYQRQSCMVDHIAGWKNCASFTSNWRYLAEILIYFTIVHSLQWFFQMFFNPDYIFLNDFHLRTLFQFFFSIFFYDVLVPHLFYYKKICYFFPENFIFSHCFIVCCFTNANGGISFSYHSIIFARSQYSLHKNVILVKISSKLRIKYAKISFSIEYNEYLPFTNQFLKI